MQNIKNYYLSDNLHSTSVLTDQSGNVIENTTYYPFGDIRSGGTRSKQLYTGQENDPETGLDYYNARYYNSHIKRFTQPDSIIPNVYDPQMLNRYAYVRNNPLRYTDPSGHFFVVDDAIEIVFLAGLAFGAYQAITHPAQTINAVKTVASIPYSIDQTIGNALPKPASPPIASTQTRNSPPAAPVPQNINRSTPQGGGPQIPDMNPFQKIAPLLPPIINSGGNNWKTNASIDEGLNAAEEWLGNG